MKVNHFVFCFFLFTMTVKGQEVAFDLVRNNQLEELKSLVLQDKTTVNQKNKDGFSLLILASYRGNLEIVEFLLKNGAFVNDISQMGTALMAASVKNKLAIAERLIQAGAHVNSTDEAQTSALHLAVQFNNVEMVKFLLNHNADKTKRDAKGKTPFEYAVFSGNETLITLLKY